MPELISQTTISLPREEVWSRLRDLRVAKNYVPGVTDIEITTPQQEGVGASRKVFMEKRPPVDETVVAWEEGRGFALRIHNGDKPAKPFSDATFRYEISDAPGETTAVRFVFRYDMAMGVLGSLLDALVVRRSIRNSNNQVAANMKVFYETGQITNPALI